MDYVGLGHSLLNYDLFLFRSQSECDTILGENSPEVKSLIRRENSKIFDVEGKPPFLSGTMMMSLYCSDRGLGCLVYLFSSIRRLPMHGDMTI